MRQGRLTAVILAAVLLTGCASTGGPPLSDQNRLRAAEANTQLGFQYMQRDELQQALRKLQKAVEQNPRSADAHMATGLVYERMDNAEESERFLRRAVELDGENSQALNNYGRVVCRQGRIDEALELFRRAAANPLYETPELALTNGAACALRAQRSEEAEAMLQRALQTNARYGPALLQMARVRHEADEHLAARGYFQRFSEVSRQTPASAWLGLRIEHALGDEDAVASLGLLLKNRFSDSSEARELREWERDGRI